ncbi:MAG: tetratricopeptide repeat protein [Elusimicrobia bacterium]|nr:tetratricopeptide repeat protein [Elusimicrobiota bacterium]
MRGRGQGSTASSHGAESKKAQLLPAALILLILAATLAVFWPALGHEFVAWDDDINVYENPLLHPVTGDSFRQLWRAPYLRLYIPLTYSVWAAVAAWCQNRAGIAAALPPGPFHAVSVAVHLLNAAAAFFLLRRVLRLFFRGAESSRGGAGARSADETPPPAALDGAAAAGALFFSIHPIQVEPLAWVSGFRDALSGLGALVCLERYLAAVSPTAGAGGGGGRWRSLLDYAIATAAFGAALLSKPSAIVIPFLAAILDWGILRRGWGRVIASLGPWFILAGVCAFMTQSSQGATHIRALVPLWARPLIALDSLAFYLSKLALPLKMSPDYGRPPDLVMAKGWLYYTWLLPAALTAAVYRFDRRRMLWVGAGLFVAGVLPVLGFVPFLHQDLSTVADRYLYLSMFGPSLVWAWALARWAPARRAGWLAAALVLALLSLRSRSQAMIWRNTGTLFGHIVALNPDSGVAHANLGNYLMRQGKLDEAKFHFQETLRVRGGDGIALNNLGNLSALQGRWDDAISYYRQALKNKVPDNVVDAHMNLGNLLAHRGKPEEALRHYQEALKIQPHRVRVHLRLAQVLAQQGKSEEALSHYRWALELRPHDPEAHQGMAMLLASLDRLEEARVHFARGMGTSAESLSVLGAICDSMMVRDRWAPAAECYAKIVQRAPQMAEARNSLGYALARLGRREEALPQYREAIRLNAGYKQAHLNLGALFLESGRLDEAIAAWSGAAQAIPDSLEIRHNLGIALLQRGRHPQARAQFEAALKLDPNFQPSRRALEEMRSKGL